ncbi:MAG TPA: hypothetical protein VFP68_20415, partial [Burkholderiaceae bacterium]|nr:hypothetical protein [Burkholderiaceae bacterium]
MGLSRGALVDPADLTKGYIKSTEVAPGKDGQTADAETIELARDVLAALHGAGPPADQLDKARARLAADALGFAASASAEDSARLCEGLGKLFHRLEASHGDKAIATLEASIVAQTASVLFGPQGTNDMHAGTQAVEDLLASDANSLHERISNAMASALPSNDPVLLLSAALASQPGGMHRLAALMGDSSIGSVRMESLSVGLSSWQEATQADLPKDQRDLLRRAANYAAGLAGSGHAEWSGEELREGRIAYQSVRNGMVQRGEGSDYEAANKWLEKFGSKWLERTSERNIRATSTFYGGALNAASTLIPKQSKTIPFRKTAMQAAAQAASAAGVLPEPLAACQEMDRDGAKLRKLLGEREAVRSGVRQSAEEVALDKLAKRCLDLLKLGELPVLQALPTLTPLSKLPELNMPILTGLALAGIRKSVPEFDALGPEFAKEWAKLETGGPNVAQVLSLLTTCMLSQCMSRADHATPSWRGRPSLLERGKHADSLAQEAVADFGSAATHAGDFASACGLPQDAPLVLMAGLATQARQQLQSLPPWQLHELSTAHFEAIEESFGREQWSALPEAFKEAWNQLKQEKTGASEVAALIHGGL